MEYSEFIDLYEQLFKTSKKLEKVTLLAQFLRRLKDKGKSEWIYLLRGSVTAEYDSREFGISTQLALRAIQKAYGASEGAVVKEYHRVGDLGETAATFAGKKRQSALFGKKLDVAHLFSNLSKLLDMSGSGSVEAKLSLISELLLSATEREARYVLRTLLGDLRVGVADALMRDALAEAFFPDEKESMKVLIGEKYDLVNDLAVIFDAAVKGKEALMKISLFPGRPMHVMLPVKVTSIEEAFEACGKPAAFEHKYDGFRMVIHKKGKEIILFTRKLENVTRQFPDVVEAVKKHVKGDSFILDSEVVGFESGTHKYMPFEAISQRIKRKHDIEKLVKKLPVEIKVFDILYLDSEILISKPFAERRKILEGVIVEKPWIIRPSVQLISDKEGIAQKFYTDALKEGEEGVMVKNLSAPYQHGRRAGFMVKLKPVVADLDLVIIGAEYGTGKRGGWLTSYIVACRNSNGEFLEVGKVSSGLKELEGEGTTYEQMTALLKPLVTGESGGVVHAAPKLVVAVTYQNVQKSPSYSSGYALRFPRITAYRPDKPVDEIATLADIEKESAKGQR